MPKKLPPLDDQLVAQIEAALLEPQPPWAWRRLTVVRLLGRRDLTVPRIMAMAKVSRQTVFTYRNTLLTGGMAALLDRKKAPGAEPLVQGAVEAELLRQVLAGKFRRAKNARVWLQRKTGETLSESAVRKVLARLRVQANALREQQASAVTSDK